MSTEISNTHAVATQADISEMSMTDYGMQAVVSVDQAVRRIKELQAFVHAVMVKGEDYGIIPGTQKPSLLKPGAEKLCEMYGLTPTFEVIDAQKDWEDGFVYYEVKCSLIAKRSGLVAAEGVGSCNNRESRYKHRDVYTLANTILKMAKKRAHVDAALSATRSSGLFTQDVEDMVEEPARSPAKRPITRRDLVAAWQKLSARGVSVSVQVEKLNQSWSDQELIEKARAWKEKIAAAEDALAAMHEAAADTEEI